MIYTSNLYTAVYFLTILYRKCTIHIRHIYTKIYKEYIQHIWDVCTGWWRSIRCLKLQVIFRKRANNCRALLRKTTYKGKVSYDSTPPCMRNIYKTCRCKNVTHTHTLTHTHTYTYTYIHIHIHIHTHKMWAIVTANTNLQKTAHYPRTHLNRYSCRTYIYL